MRRLDLVIVLIAAVASFAVGMALWSWHRATPAVAAAPVSTDHPLVAGAVDIGFAQDMSLHHEQAIAMATLALDKGSPMAQQLARMIVTQQLKEIGHLQGWLMAWGAPAMAPTTDMAWLREAYRQLRQRDADIERVIDVCLRGDGMPGMATAQEMDALAHATPPAFDAMFFTLMSRHHQGALTMAAFASEHASLDFVRGYASSMLAEQRQEMAQMLRLVRMPVQMPVR